MRIAGTLLAVMLLVPFAAGQEQTAPPQTTFRSGSRTVPVYVTVTDKSGRLLTDLTQGDFEVYDEGKKQTLTLFESGVQPITLVMMLDRSGSMASNFRLVRSAAEQFVGHLLPGDKARIGSFADRIGGCVAGLCVARVVGARTCADRRSNVRVALRSGECGASPGSLPLPA